MNEEKQEYKNIGIMEYWNIGKRKWNIWNGRIKVSI
jgi:hypothetical protein